MKTAFLAPVFLALAACTEVSETPKTTETFRQIPVTDDFTEMRLRWSSNVQVNRSGPADYFYAFKTIVADGKIEICGAGSYSKSTGTSESRSVMRGAKILLEDRVILEDLRYFSNLGTKRKLIGEQANCRSTGVDAPAGGFGVSLVTPGRRITG
ncbi:hypothetical protein [uncultured Roseobacter sp.]|uniref:hypothetical protein n=1 Tax=uncultured Roseobacter sp. TaxID=114847 RepID=UPI0026337872|nr:hypothetical protein [uncultured Roseobacter sp.]